MTAPPPADPTRWLPPQPRLRVSVIVPVLNEAQRIARQLTRLLDAACFDEIIVVDGDSDDGTRAIVDRFGDAVTLLRAPRGRARQMNAGARAATGDALLFLHADVILPSNVADWVASTLHQPNVVAGAFQTWTVSDVGPTWLKNWLHLADLRSRYSKLPYGDQALFVHAWAFHEVGGFDEDLILFEDYELSRSLSRLGEIVTVPEIVTVSGRRFMARPIYYLCLLNVMPLLYRAGVPPSAMLRLYGAPR